MPFLHKILVVDDEEKIRKSLSGLLQDEGYDVVTAGSGTECLHIMSSQNIDLVILDIVMPEMSGIDVLKKIKEKNKDTEVIVISGYADKEKAIATFRLNAYDLIEKPFESREILNTISHCLNQLSLRKEIEKKSRELRESEEQYRLLAENVVDVIWTMDIKSLRTTYVSPSVTGLRGYSVEEVMGQTLEETLTPSSLDVATRTLKEEIKDKKLARKLGIYLSRKYTGEKLKEIANIYGKIGDTGISQVCCRVEKAIKENSRLERIIRGLEQKIM